MLRGGISNTHFIYIGVTRSWIDTRILRTSIKHANKHITERVDGVYGIQLMYNKLVFVSSHINNHTLWSFITYYLHRSTAQCLFDINLERCLLKYFYMAFCVLCAKLISFVINMVIIHVYNKTHAFTVFCLWIWLWLFIFISIYYHLFYYFLTFYI